MLSRIARRILKKPEATPQLGGRDFLDVTYATPAVPPRESLAKKLAFGVLCSALVTAMMNLLSIKKGIVYGCALMLWVCGWRTEPPKGSAEARQGGFFAKNLEKAKKALHAGVGKAKAVKEKAAEPVKHAVHNGVAKVEAKVETAKVEVAKGKDELKDALRGGSRGTQGGLPQPPGAADPRLALSNRAEVVMRDRLTARAMAVNLPVNPEWGVAVLELEVNKAEDAEWHKRYNAQCLYCRTPLHIPPERRNTNGHCMRCRRPLSAKLAMKAGPPMRPNTGKPLRPRG